MKRITAVFMVLMLLALAACQATPDTPAVVGKSSLDEALLQETAASRDSETEEYTGEEFTSTDGSVHFSFCIESVPSMSSAPVVEVTPLETTAEDCQRIAQVLLGDADFYEREPSSSPVYSKSEYQAMIQLFSPYATQVAMEELVGVSSAEDELEAVKNTISVITAAMEIAPEENPHTVCDWTLKKERVYNDTEDEISGRDISEDNDWLIAIAQKEDISYKYMVVSRNKEDYKLNRFLIQLGGATVDSSLERQIYWARLCRTEEPTQQQIDAVQDKVEMLLEELDLGQWVIAETQTEVYGTSANPEYMLRFNAVPAFQGVSALYGQNDPQKADDYTGAYVLTNASFLMSANGDLIEFSMNSPLEEATLINENVETMSFSDLMQRAQEYLSLSDAGNYGITADTLAQYETTRGEKILCEIEINSVSYGLARVQEENTTDRYYYLPAVLVSGGTQYVGEESGDILYTASDVDYVLLNAVDGSVIQ